MAQAKITINGVAGSNDDLPINTLVQLSNQNTGGESTFAWSILDQPPGATDVLSNPNILNPTFTPKKEGTYMLLLIVNQGTAGELRDEQFVGIRFLKSRERAPGAGETSQDSAGKGWSAAANLMWGRLNNILSDPGIIIGTAGAAGLQAGNTVYVSGVATLKAGLPGQEFVPSFTIARASVYAETVPTLGVVIGGVDGSSTPANGAVIAVRVLGRYGGVTFGAAPSLGDPVYQPTNGLVPSLVQGTFKRILGYVIAVGASTFDFMMDGSSPKQSYSTLLFGATTTPANNASNYLKPGGPIAAAGTGEVFLAVTEPCMLRGFQAVATAGPVTDLQTITVRKNGVDTSMLATMAAAATTANDTNIAHAVQLVAGDTLSVKIVGGGSIATGAVNIVVSLDVVT